MLSLTFDEFSEGNYMEQAGKCLLETDHKLYVVKNVDDVLYVGISETGVWNRWFGSLGRMRKNAGGYWFGHDAISIEIAEHVPESLKYTIELYSVDDLCELFKDELGEKYARESWRELSWALRDLEAMMIHKLRPALNVQNNDFGRDLHPEESEAASIRAVYAAFGYRTSHDGDAP